MTKTMFISAAFPNQKEMPEIIKAMLVAVFNDLYFKKPTPKITRLTDKHKPGRYSVSANDLLPKTEVTIAGKALCVSIG